MHIVARQPGMIAFVAITTMSMGLAGCSHYDPNCNDPPPIGSSLQVVLVDQSGRPLCEEPFVLLASQPRASIAPRELTRVEGLFANVDESGRVEFVGGETCNVWMHTGPDWQACGVEVEVHVEHPGCEPADVSWTWRDNFEADNDTGRAWLVPVRLVCR